MIKAVGQLITTRIQLKFPFYLQTKVKRTRRVSTHKGSSIVRVKYLTLFLQSDSILMELSTCDRVLITPIFLGMEIKH